MIKNNIVKGKKITDINEINAISPDLLPVDLAVMNADVDALHILPSEILVEILSHRAVAVNFIAVPLPIGAYIDMRVLVGGGDIGNAREADILRLTADVL